MDGKNEPPLLPGDRLAAMTRQSKKTHKFTTGRSLSSRRNSIDPSTDTLFPITYCGTIPYKNKPVNSDTVDSFVKCLSSRNNRPSSADKYKKWSKRKRGATFTSPKTNRMFRLQSSGSADEVDFTNGPLDEEVEERDEDMLVSKSLSDINCVERAVNLASSPTNSPSLSITATTNLSSNDADTPPLNGDNNYGERSRSVSLGANYIHSVSSIKRKPWSFRNLKKFHGSPNTDQTDSTSSLKGENSPGSLQKYDSSSLGGSMGSLRETGSDIDNRDTPPPRRSETAPIDNTLPTPAIRVSNLESSGEIDDDNENENEPQIEQEQENSDKGE